MRYGVEQEQAAWRVYDEATGATVAAAPTEEGCREYIEWRERLIRRLFALLGEARITERRARLNLYRWFCHDLTVTSTDNLDERELRGLADLLEDWKRRGELEAQARSHTGDFEG
jgi:hypothetical protein